MNLLTSHPSHALVLAKVSEDVAKRAAAIRLMVFDVDGVLTDGSLWYGEQGEVIKRFHVLDGHGLKMLTTSGIHVALLTARDGPILAWRAAELGISRVLQGVRDKAQVLTELVQREKLSFDAVGYMGDDLIDMPAMQKAGFAVTVPNAPAYVAQGAHWVTTAAGGQGAARECCDVILAAQQKLGLFFQHIPLGAGAIQ
jgi:3-deoxy-D-manno-octulosonate 8-phosphate phosphatase (KDO 8-P phosphatase)